MLFLFKGGKAIKGFKVRKHGDLERYVSKDKELSFKYPNVFAAYISITKMPFHRSLI